MNETKFGSYTIKYLTVDINEEIYRELLSTVCNELNYDYAYPLIIEADVLGKTMADKDAWSDVEPHIMEEIKAIYKQVDYSIDRIELI